MGGAVARGLAAGRLAVTSDITVSNPSRGKLDGLRTEYPDLQTTCDNVQAAQGADVVILAVKPWLLRRVIDELKPHLDYSRQVIASMVGGVGTAELTDLLRRDDTSLLPPVYYLIPNTAVAVGQSMTFLTSVRSTPEMDERLLALFKELGDALLVEERLMNAGMVLASCGIAYAMRYVRAATEGGVELGMFPDMARRVVLQTLRGAVELLETTGNHPEAEIDKVTTAGGITIRGLNEMEHAGFTSSVIRGLKASAKNDTNV